MPQRPAPSAGVYSSCDPAYGQLPGTGRRDCWHGGRPCSTHVAKLGSHAALQKWCSLYANHLSNGVLLLVSSGYGA